MTDHAFPDPRGEKDAGATYEEHYDLLVGVAVERFGILHEGAETLVHEIFSDFLVHAERICDRRVEPLPEYGPVAEQWPAEIAAREVFAGLTPCCQLALRLPTIEGRPSEGEKSA